MIRLVVVLALFVFAPTRADARLFDPESFTLDNGMQVVVIPNHRVPVVTHMVWYKVGAADEAPGKSGTAHFLEHLMFKGTSRFPGGMFSEVVAGNGGRQNAFTSYDYTGYFQTVTKDKLPLMMELEADRMTNLVLSEEDLATERDVVIEERRSRVDNSPAARLQEQVSAALYLNHPYRRPVIGWYHELIGLDRDSIIDFYQTWYAPNNAILVVAGDITVDELRPLAEKYYGVIPAVDTPSRNWLEEPPPQASRTVELRDARVRQSSWQRTYLAPSYGQGARKQADALQVVADILGGGATSRLYRSLVIEQGVAVSAGASYGPDSRGPGRMTVYAVPAPGFTPGDVAGAVDAEIAKLLSDGVSKGDVARSVSSMLANAVFARDSLATGARVLGAALASGRTIEDVETWPDRMARITPADVVTAAQDVFDDRRSVSARLLPPGEQP